MDISADDVGQEDSFKLQASSHRGQVAFAWSAACILLIAYSL